MEDEPKALLRPTTKDLARAAGVSRATVDRVLNGRDGVHRKTVERVHAAIRELGFVRNLAAANLAKRRAYRFLFVLPRTGDLFLAELTAQVSDAVRVVGDDPIRVDLHRVDANDPHALAAHLLALPEGRWDGIAIMAPRSPQLRDAVRALAERGLPALPFVTGQSLAEADGFVGIDNRAAGETAGLLLGRFVGPRDGSVMVVAETMKAQDSLDRRHGFDRQLAMRFPHLSALPSIETYGSTDRTRATLAACLRHNPDLCGLYVLASEARQTLDALSTLARPGGLVTVVHERTAATVAALASGRVDAIITQDPGHLARSALRRLKAGCDGAEVDPAQERIRTEILLPTNL